MCQPDRIAHELMPAAFALHRLHRPLPPQNPTFGPHPNPSRLDDKSCMFLRPAQYPAHITARHCRSASPRALSKGHWAQSRTVDSTATARRGFPAPGSSVAVAQPALLLKHHGGTAVTICCHQCSPRRRRSPTPITTCTSILRPRYDHPPHNAIIQHTRPHAAVTPHTILQSPSR
jgi:hypothetical protein